MQQNEYGVDIFLNNKTKDIEVTNSGDILTVQDEELLEQAIYNRLKTQVDEYQRYILDKNHNIRQVDKDYGNPVYYYLSSTLDIELKDKLYEYLSQEDRIQITNIDMVQNKGAGEYEIIVEYISNSKELFARVPWN